VPLTQFFIDRFGWRHAFVALAGIVVASGLLPVALWMRRSPEAMGLRPDGEPFLLSERDVGLVERELERSVSPREAVRSREFWLIAIAFGLTVSGRAWPRGCSAARRRSGSSASSASAG
jgi:sugar phosphate permease